MNGHYTHSDGTPLAPNERVDNEGRIYIVTEYNAPDYAHKIADVIERITWQIGVMRKRPRNRIADAVTLSARDVEALIEAARRAQGL